MRLATDVSVRRQDAPVVPLLVPFLGSSVGGPTAWDRRFDRWHDAGGAHHELVDELADADVVVLPTDWYWVRGPSWASRPDRELARRLADLHRRAQDHGIPTLVHFTGDRSCDRVGLDGAIVLREGGFRSRMGPHDRVLPAFAEDLVAEHLGGVPEIRRRGDRPVVGFCGLAGRGRGRGAAAVARRIAFHGVVALRERRIDPSPRLGEEIRATALDLLRDDPSVDTNFVVRDSSVFFRDADTGDLTDVRKEYVENLASCDYVLCVRGSGNYSYRLYEALSMGRIPVIVDTDVALPASDDVPWSEIAVFVAPDDLSRLPQIVAEHHAACDDQAFLAIQEKARDAWLTHLSPVAFYGNLEQVVGAADPA